MSTQSKTPTVPATQLPAGLAAGVTGGLAGGLVFGVMMQMMGMLPMVAMLAGSKSIAMGWLVHLAISAFIGGAFAVLFGRRARKVGLSAGIGLVYGAAWWVLGPLLIMPARLGMPIFTFNSMTSQSLMGHLIYGLILGAVYVPARARFSRTYQTGPRPKGLA